MYHNQTKTNGTVPDEALLNEQSRRILNAALDLAENGREDDEAVAELTALTSRHRHDADVAVLSLSSQNEKSESRVANTAYRLLQAAISGQKITQPTEADIALMGAVEPLRGLSRGTMFRELATKEPRLDQIEALVRTGELGGRLNLGELPSMSPEERRTAATAYLEQITALRDRLRVLVGPEAELDDLAIRSYFAQANVRDYLGDLRA